MDIAKLYSDPTPSTPPQTTAARSRSSNSFSSGLEHAFNRKTAYAMSGRPKLTDSEINELARKYDLRNMTQETYDAFLDDLVDKGVLTRAETGYFGYGGVVRPDPMDNKLMTVSVAGQESRYSQNTPFLPYGASGNGDMAAWLAEMMRSADYSAYPEAGQRVRQRCEMYGALYDIVTRASGPACAASGEEGSSVIEQLADPGSAFYQDMFQRLKIQMELSDEQKKEQAIIDALDDILEGMRSSDRPDKRTDVVTSMAGLSKEISQLEGDDPRRVQLDLFRQRLNQMGMYMDLGESIFGGTKENGLTLTQQLIREKTEGFDPSAFDLF